MKIVYQNGIAVSASVDGNRGIYSSSPRERRTDLCAMSIMRCVVMVLIFCSISSAGLVNDWSLDETSGLVAADRAGAVANHAKTAVEGKALASLDGRHIAEAGILVTNSGKVNIDNLTISNCTGYGVDYSGRGESLLKDAGSVTRREISGCGISGIRVTQSARFVLMDNIVTDNALWGIDVFSQSATVVGNTCTRNENGMSIGAPYDVDGPDSVVTRNNVINNNHFDLISITTNYVTLRTIRSLQPCILKMRCVIKR